MRNTVPRLPQLADDELAAYRDAHGALELDLVAAAEPVQLLWRRLITDHALMSLARIEPTVAGTPEPPLVPAPRAFLGSRDRARRDGVIAAFTYVDTRLTMGRQGLQPTALVPEAPYVLHALSEGRCDSPQATNPGMPRATENWWQAARTTFRTAEPADTRRVLDEAMQVAIGAAEPACAVGAWLTVVVCAAHPFVDGNGRVARLLYLLASGAELPRTVDWGVAEQLLFHREQYVAALKLSHMADGVAYDGADIDPLPYARFVTAASARGADLARRRLAAVTELVATVASWGVGQAEAPLVASLAWRRLAGAPTLATDAGLETEPTLDALERLASGGAVQRRSWPASRLADADGPAYALTADAAASLGGALAQV